MATDQRLTETLVTIATLRQLCGAKPGEIEALVRARLLTSRAGKIGLVAGIRAYLDSIRSATKPFSLAAAQDAARTARADAPELSLQVDTRQLIRQAEADDAVAHLCGAVMSRTLTIPARSTRDIPERRKIEAAVRTAQSEVAARVASADTEGDLAPARPAKQRAGTRK